MKAGRCKPFGGLHLERGVSQGGEHRVAGGIHPGLGADLLETAPAGKRDGFGIRPGQFGVQPHREPVAFRPG